MTVRSFFLAVCGLWFMAAMAEAMEKPRQVILLIGDGMGISHLTAAEIEKGAPLAVERSRVVGLIKTRSANSLITDSAAGGMALASGVKADNYQLGVDPSGTPVATLMELGQERGLATGVVVTSAVTHATPAAFYAHQEKRKAHSAIVEDLLRSRLEVVIGGGSRYFDLSGQGQYRDGMAKLGDFWVVTDLLLARQLPAGRLLALLADEWLPPAAERGDLLLRGTKEALRRLEKNSEGFLLMVEGSQIDYYSHKRNSRRVLDEMLDFDQVIAYAFDYADAHPGTLVVVTADHETGGFAITGPRFGTGRMQTGWVSKRHTGSMVPVFAHGAGAEIFAGIYENTEVFHKIVTLMGWRNEPLSP